MASPTVMSDRTWRTRDDVRTLAEARRIEADTKRLKAAKAEAKRMLAEEQKRLDAIEDVAEGEAKDRDD